MFLFFPFVAGVPVSPARRSHRTGSGLPMLPRNAPSSARGLADLSGAVGHRSEDPFVDLVRRILTSFTSSLTALGSRTNALFAQVAAALALDRAARDTAHSFGTNWPGFDQYDRAPVSLGSFWQGNDPISFSLLQKPMSLSAPTPWVFFTDAIELWTKIWAPASPQYIHGSRARPEPAASFSASVPFAFFSWGFALGAAISFSSPNFSASRRLP
jgi:hypothetical protein